MPKHLICNSLNPMEGLELTNPRPRKDGTALAEQWQQGVPINPQLPKGFWLRPNKERPEEHQKWWNVPFIEKEPATPEFPIDLFKVYCLDGKDPDGPSYWGPYKTLGKALMVAMDGPKPELVDSF